MIELVIFLILSLLLLVFTLRRPYRHRFYRFLAFEAVIGLVLRQAGSWFTNPFSGIQILSWIFLTGSAYLALHAVRQLRVLGAPKGDIENTTRLVTEGAYRFIRHPLYGSLLMLGVGAFLKRVDILSFFLTCMLAGILVATARVEEQENLERFGEAYRHYMSRTKMFIPYIF